MSFEMLGQDLHGIAKALETRDQKLLFAGIFALAWLAYAVLTDIIVLQDAAFNPNLKLLDAAAITAIALLSSLLATCMFYIAKNNIGGARGTKRGILGSAVGAFATACPICQPIWLVWLELGSQTLFLVEISPLVQATSIALLLVSLHFAAQGISNKTCAPAELKKHARVKQF